MGRSWSWLLCICTARPVTVICTGNAEELILLVEGISGSATVTTNESALRRAKILRLRTAPSTGQHSMTPSSSRHILMHDVFPINTLTLLRGQNYTFPRKKTNNLMIFFPKLLETIASIGTMCFCSMPKRTPSMGLNRFHFRLGFSQTCQLLRFRWVFQNWFIC